MNPLSTDLSAPYIQDDGDSIQTESFLNRKSPKILYPFQLMALSVIFAWFYTAIPNTDFWVYNCVKQEIWAVMVTIASTEYLDASLPDTPDIYYVASYIVGLLVALLIGVLTFVSGGYSTGFLYVQVFGTTSSILGSLICYGIHAYFNRTPTDNSALYRYLSAESISSIEMYSAESKERPMKTLFSTYFDVFDVVNENENTCSNANEETSSGRADWFRIRKGLKVMNSTALSSTSIVAEDCFKSIYLPRFYLRSNRQYVGSVLCDRFSQWMLVSCYGISIHVLFYFLSFFTLFFRANENSNNSIVLFAFFVVMTSFIRIGVKRLGLALDKRKLGTSSMFFVGEFAGLSLYYGFYRVLFESLKSWKTFVFIQIFHLGSEWILYPCRCSSYTIPYLLWLESSIPCCKYSFIPRGTNNTDWMEFVATDLGIRVVIMVSTGVGMIILLLSVDGIPWVTNSLKQSGYSRDISLTYIAIAVVLELMNTFLMNKYFFIPNNVSIRHKVTHVFRDRRFVTIVTPMFSAVLMSIIYGFTTDNTY